MRKKQKQINNNKKKHKNDINSREFIVLLARTQI